MNIFFQLLSVWLLFKKNVQQFQLLSPGRNEKSLSRFPSDLFQKRNERLRKNTILSW